MKNNKITYLTETSIMAALSVVLSFISIWKMPQGGSVTAGCMVPIILISFRRGYKYGIVCGAISGLFQFILTGQAFHPISIILDYILAYGILGIAGLFKGSFIKILSGTSLAVIGRFICHLVSGATIFAAYAPESQNPWIYSFVYNGAYILPELIITLIFIAFLHHYANKFFKPKRTV